jgi:hypothetical protein
MTLEDSWEDSILETIESFPTAHRDAILKIWYLWLDTTPEPPLYESWSEFSKQADDQEALFTERRVYLKRITNELRDMEVPLTMTQKIARALAAVASLFLVVFLAVSRAFRVAE